jgi:hypothetical protein
MAAKDLITLSRAEQSMQNYTPGSNDAVVNTLITACSDAIEKYCKRRFLSTSFDELYNGNGDRRLLLRQYPLQHVKSVRYRPVTVLKAQNTGTSQQVQQARCWVTSTGLQCWRMASGVATTETLLTWASYPTLQSLATAVTGLGNNWSGQVVGDTAGDYGAWPSADLYIPGSYGDTLEGSGTLESQGALNACRVFAELKMHTFELSGFQWDARGWLLRAIPYTDPELLHPEDLIWPIGINNFRIQYTAGYTTVPEAVQEACAEWVNALYQLASRDPAAEAINLGGASIRFGTHQLRQYAAARPPDHVARLLQPYKRSSVFTNQS